MNRNANQIMCKKNNNNKTLNPRRILRLIAIALLIVGTSFTMISCSNSENSEATKKATLKKIKKEISSYKTMKNGIRIFDMSKNHYFLKEQKGYNYPTETNIKYYSNVLHKKRTAKVFLPANYDKSKEYPILFLLHGLNGTQNTWGNKTADVIIQNLTYFENVPEMIIVCPDSNLNYEQELSGLNFLEAVKYFDKTRDEVVDSLIPELKEQYKIKKGRNNMAIAGHSLGGRNALYTAFSYPEIFGYVGAFAPVKVANYGELKWIKPLLKTFKLSKGKEMKKIVLSVGTDDDRVGKSVDELSAFMNKEGVKHIFYHMPGGHENKIWKNSLYNFARYIFK